MKLFLALLLAAAGLAVIPANAQTLPNATAGCNLGECYFTDANGLPLAGGLLYHYAAGTTMEQDVYSDSTASTPLAQPIVLDASGKTSLWMGPTAYKFVLEDANMVQQWENDDVLDTALYFVNYVKQIGTATLINYTGAGTGGVTRTVAAGLLDAVKAADYGAVCDGSTDDSAHIQAALTYAATTPGANRTVLLPAGICVANITLAGNQSINGAGLATANPDGPGQVTELKDASGGGKAVITVTSGTSYASVRNVKLVGNGTDGSGPTDRGIYAANSNYLDVENVSCNLFAEECIRWEAGVALRIVHMTADQTLLNRTRAAHSGSIYLGGTDAFVSDTEVGTSSQIEGHSASSSCFNDAIVVLGADNALVNVHGEFSELGLYMGGGGQSRVINSIFDQNFCSGAWIAAGENLLNNILFLRNGQDGNNTWDGFEVPAANGQFTNLVFDQTSGAPTLTFGITDSGSGGNANYNSFSNIRFYSIGGPVWNVTNAGPEIFYGYKDAVTIADGTTSPDLTGFQSFSFLQSTSLAITSFSGGTPGQEVCFLGNPNVTFGTGGNILPPNGIAVPLQSSMIYCYRNLGGVWYWINTDNNPQFNDVTATTATITDVTVGHAHGVAGTPAIAVTNCGSGCNASIVGTDFGGRVTINTGTGVPTFATAVTITWSRTYQGFGAVCVVSPMSNYALSAGVYPPVYMASSGSGTAIIATGAIGLAGSSTYQYAYICTQSQ